MDKNQIKAYLERELMITFGEDGMTEDTNLFDDGIMDSFAFVQFVTHIESEFGISFSDEEMIKAPLTSLNGACRVIEGKTSVA